MTTMIVIIGIISIISLNDVGRSLESCDSRTVMNQEAYNVTTQFDMDQIRASLIRFKSMLMIVTMIGIFNGCLLGMFIARSIFLPLNRVLNEAEETRKELAADEILDRTLKSLSAVIRGHSGK